jgi:hypothetical protein
MRSGQRASKEARERRRAFAAQYWTPERPQRAREAARACAAGPGRIQSRLQKLERASVAVSRLITLLWSSGHCAMLGSRHVRQLEMNSLLVSLGRCGARRDRADLVEPQRL